MRSTIEWRQSSLCGLCEAMPVRPASTSTSCCCGAGDCPAPPWDGEGPPGGAADGGCCAVGASACAAAASLGPKILDMIEPKMLIGHAPFDVGRGRARPTSNGPVAEQFN